jgi:hypothetical protein
MTATSLISAVTVGLVLGVLARWLVAACRSVPFWLPPAAGVGAAVLATVAARLAGVDGSQVSLIEVILQLGAAGLSLSAVAATGDRQRSAGRYGRTGRPR